MDIKSKILVHSCPPSKFGGLAHFQTLAQTDNRLSLLKKLCLKWYIGQINILTFAPGQALDRL